MNNIVLTDEERELLLNLFDSSLNASDLTANDLEGPFKSIYIKLGGKIE